MDDAPDKNATSILILQGFVMKIGNGQTLVQCPTSGVFYVCWKGKRFPNIKVGQYITLRGKIITLRLGEAFLVIGAELLRPSSLKHIKKFINEMAKEEHNETPADS